MSKTSKRSPSLLQGDEVPQADARLAKLMQRCGIEVMPACHAMLVPIESITVPDLELVHLSSNFVNTIWTYGIRQPPSVAFCSGTAYDAPDARYVVVMGSRRVVSARRLFFDKQDPRFKVIKCEVYERNVPGLNDVLALMENSMRSDAWVRDIIRLRRLVEQQIAMTLDDLAEFGFNRRTIGQKLKIALLPGAILDPICAGEVTWGMAMQIIKLKEEQLKRLETLVQGGKALTSELVKQVYRGQIDQGLAAVHATLLQMWAEQPVTNFLATGNRHAGTTLAGVASQNGSLSVTNTPSPGEVLAMLQRFEQLIQHDRALSHLATLTQVYITELQAVLRTSPVPTPIETKDIQEVLHG